MTTEERKDYFQRFLRKHPNDGNKKRVTHDVMIKVPDDLFITLKRMTILAGMNKLCVRNLMANIVINHLDAYKETIQELFAESFEGDKFPSSKQRGNFRIIP